MKYDNLFIAMHTHKHGIDVYPFISDSEPDKSVIIQSLCIDFEEEKDEYLDVYSVHGEIKHIK